MKYKFLIINSYPSYAVPGFPLAVPKSLTSKSLNALVNDLLKGTTVRYLEAVLLFKSKYYLFLLAEADSTRKIVEFDFLINGEFLRTDVSEFLKEREISSEDVIEVEYIEKHPPPEPQDCLIHDDWVSAVAVKNNWYLFG